MKDNYLGLDPEDIGDVLKKIEKSLDIKFGTRELENVRTFGELIDIILSKLELQETHDCTSQQAFYKLRTIICETININQGAIKPDTDLSSLFQKDNRKKIIKAIESKLGFKLKLFKPNRIIALLLIVGILCSIGLIFFQLMYGIITLSAFLLIRIIVYKTSNELKVKTVADVVQIMIENNYLKSRVNSSTVNKAEVTSIIKKMFLTYLATDLKDINRDTVIA